MTIASPLKGNTTLLASDPYGVILIAQSGAEVVTRAYAPDGSMRWEQTHPGAEELHDGGMWVGADGLGDVFVWANVGADVPLIRYCTSNAGDLDGDATRDCTASLHEGPSNTNLDYDNCVGLPNADQVNTDGNFIDSTPPTTQDDKTWPKSDALGDECDTDDDNDGISDADEGTGAFCGGKVTDPLLRDSDGDRILDGVECVLATDPTSSASKPTPAQCGPTTDVDGDRLSARTEFCGYNTNPNIADTDGDMALDGAKDGCEAASLNGDRVVNAGDQLLMVLEILRELTPSMRLVSYDINKDGAVNAGDQLLIAQFISPSGQCP